MKIQPLEAPASKYRNTDSAVSLSGTERMRFDLLLSAGIFQTRSPDQPAPKSLAEPHSNGCARRLLLAARTLWHGGLKNQALVIGSIAIMHSIASITNMNFAHNYYPTLLSLSVSITLLGALLQTHQNQGAS